MTFTKPKAFLRSLTEVYSEQYARFKKWALPALVVFYVVFFVFALLANIEISEAYATVNGVYGITEYGKSLYATLDTVFYILCAFLPFAVGGTAFMIALYILRKKEYNRHFNKSKLNRRIYPFDVILAIGMGIFCLLCIYPIIYVLAGSFNQGLDYTAGGVYFFPRVFTFENYKAVLTDNALWMSYLVTIGRTTIGTAAALVFTAAVSYAMSRPNLKFKPFFYWVNIFTMFFGGGLVPYFLIIKSIGLVNNFLVYIIPGLYSVYNMIVLQSGFKSIDSEIHDAAVVDGAGELRIWWQIYMPLAKPVLATVALWLLVGHWNNYFDTMIYASGDQNLQTLQHYLMRVVKYGEFNANFSGDMAERISGQTISLAAIIISIIPVLFFFPLIRKNFSSGIMVGSLKG